MIADLADAIKGIRALAPNSPDIAIAIDSNQSLVDNYVKVRKCLKESPLQFTCMHARLLDRRNSLYVGSD